MLYGPLIGFSQSTEICMRLDSALIYLTNTSDQSLSYSISKIKKFNRVCFDKNQTLNIQLKQISKYQPINYDRIGNGYTISIKNQTHIYGVIVDAESKAPLSGVAVYVEALSKGIYSDESGYYSITIDNDDSFNIETSYLGYNKESKIISNVSKIRWDVELQSYNDLPEILIDDAEKNRKFGLFGNVDSRIPLHKLYNLPSFVGTSDVMRHLTTDQGISLGADAVSQLRVRGGDVDQNLILMDGVPVFHPTHSLGFMSIFNTSTIQEANFYQDDFSSRYAGRLSSVLDVRTKNGDINTYHGQANIGLLGAGLTLEGPIVENKASFILQGRRSIGTNFISGFEALTDIIIQEVDTLYDGYGYTTFIDTIHIDTMKTSNKLYFYEIFGKLNLELSGNTNVQIGAYKGWDDYENKIEDISIPEEAYFNGNFRKFNWTNELLYLNWNQIINGQFKFKLNVYSSTYKYDFSNVSILNIGETDFYYGNQFIDQIKFETQFKQVGVNLDAKLHSSDIHNINFGLRLKRNLFVPGEYGFGNVENEDTEFNIQDLFNDVDNLEVDTLRYRSNRISAYVEHLYSFDSKWILKYGLVYGGSLLDDNEFNNGGKRNFWNMEPRFSLEYRPTNQLSARLSASRMIQYRHALESNQSGLANQVYVPVQDDFGPEMSDQLSLSANSKNDYFDWKTTLYYKKQKNIIRLSQNTSFLSSNSTLADVDAFYWQDNVTSGERIKYGLETKIVKNISALTLTASYNWSQSIQSYLEFIDNLEHPNGFHRTHIGIAAMTYKLRDDLSLHINWQYGTSNRLTLPEGEYDINDNAGVVIESITFEKPSALILEPYHRMDMAINYFKATPNYVHRIKFGLFDLYNRQNLAYINISIPGQDSTMPASLSRQRSKGFIASLQYSLNF